MAEISNDKAGIRRRRWSRWRVARYAGVLAALLLIAGLWLFRAPLFRGNFHAVISNEVYRSAQLSPRALEHRIRELGLRSVINLRTSGSKSSWFKAEHEITEVHGVDFHLIRMSVFMPPRATLQHLVRLIDTARRPLLLHCEMGVERSGFASAVVVLLAGGNISEARKQFGLTYGFVPLICHPDLLKVLDNYEQWLAVQGGPHTPERFRPWVENNYAPYFYRARLEPLDVPTSIARGSRATLRFLATNNESTALETILQARPWGSPGCKGAIVPVERWGRDRIAWWFPGSHRCARGISGAGARDSTISRIWTLPFFCRSRRRACEVVL